MRIIFAVFFSLLLSTAHASMGQVKTATLASDKITTGATDVVYPLGNAKTFHAFGSTSAGAGAATIVIQGSNDCVNYFTVDTLSITLATTVASDTYEGVAPYKCMRGNVTAISGTDAKVSLIMGVQL